MVIGDTEIATVGLGEYGGLNYRGYNVLDFHKNGCIFEEVIYLLLLGELPEKTNLAVMRDKISKARKLPDKLKVVLELMDKDAHPMDVLRTACSFLGTLEPEDETKNDQL